MIRKTIAAGVVAGSVALLASTAAMADTAAYHGPVYPQAMQCVRAWGNTAWAYGEAFPSAEFTVSFRPDGGSSFNLLDGSPNAAYFAGGYQRARTGTFKLCARNVSSFYVPDVTLQLHTSVETSTEPPPSDGGSTGDPTIGYQGMGVESGA